MGGGILGFVEHDDGVVEGAAAHEGERGYLYDFRLHVFAQLHGGYHVFEGVVEGLQIGVDLVFHVAGQEAEFLAGLDCGARQYDFAHFFVFEGAHGQGDGDVCLAGAGGAEGKGEVVGGKLLDEALLIGGASLYGAAAHAVDYHAVFFYLAGTVALDDVEDGFLGECVVAHGVLLELLYVALKLGCLAVLADYFYHCSAGGDAQLGEEVAQQEHVGVVDSIESDGVGGVYHDYAFDHQM